MKAYMRDRYSEWLMSMVGGPLFIKTYPLINYNYLGK